MQFSYILSSFSATQLPLYCFLRVEYNFYFRNLCHLKIMPKGVDWDFLSSIETLVSIDIEFFSNANSLILNFLSQSFYFSSVRKKIIYWNRIQNSIYHLPRSFMYKKNHRLMFIKISYIITLFLLKNIKFLMEKLWLIFIHCCKIIF